MDKNATYEKTEFQVSVVMPVYNGAEFIQKAIESVMIQDVALELIVIDDCSTDRTPDIVKQLSDVIKCQQNQFKVIRYIRNEYNIGASGSRNKGVSIATAPWVAFLDADDWWMPGKLKAQLVLLEKTKDVLCCTARTLADHQGKKLGRIIPVKSLITYKDLLKHNSINCSSVLVRADVIRDYPMTHDDSHEDYICWLHILKNYGKACGINKPYLCYRITEGSKSGNKLKSAKMTFKVYRYMGFNLFKSCILFISYAIHGIIKYGLPEKTKE